MLLTIDQAKEALRTKTSEYLREKGYRVKGMFRCPSPTHTDKTPSAHLNDSGVFCFGCNRQFDIFDLAHFFDGKPIDGPGFVEETIPYLLDHFGLGQLNISGSPGVSLTKVYNEAFKLMSKTPSKEVAEYLKSRGITKPLLKKFEVRFVTHPENILRKLRLLGIPEQAIINANLAYKDDSGVLRPKRVLTNVLMLFPIRKGQRLVGFISRRQDNMHKKYINTLNNPLINGNELLVPAPAHQTELWIVEGPVDAMALSTVGIDAVGVCGVAITEQKLQRILDDGTRDIVLCLDWDDAGRRGMENAAITIFRMGIAHRTSVCVSGGELLPDPGEILETGKHGFDPEIMDYEAWLLHRFSQKMDIEDAIDQAVSLIATSPSPLSRHASLSRLHRAMPAEDRIPIDVLMEHLNTKIREKTVKVKDAIRKEIRSAFDIAEKDPLNAVSYLESAVTRISTLHGGDIVTPVSCSRRLMEVFDHGGYVTVEHKVPGLREHYGPLALGTLIFVGGHRHHGKTALVDALIAGILRHDEDSVAVYHSVDDDLTMATIKLLATISGVPTTLIASNNLNPGQKRLVTEAQRKLKRYVDEGRLLIADASDGSSFGYTKRLARSVIRRLRPGQKMVLFIDNALNLSDPGEHREKYERIATDMQHIVAGELGAKIIIVSTLEYPKRNENLRPRSNDYKETAAWSYRGHTCFHVYNRLSVDPNSCLYWVEQEDPSRPLPYLEIIRDKDKVYGTADLGTILIRFDSRCNRLLPLDISEKEARKLLKQDVRAALRREKERN